MKFFAPLALLAACVPNAFAHYKFTQLIVNGATTGVFQYVRQYDNYYSNNPVTDVKSPAFRCNINAKPNPNTAAVTAGSQIGFVVDASISHPGVLNVYLSKAPSTAATYDGSGGWFKIYQVSAVTNGGTSITWPTDGKTSFTFTIPRNLPNGEYLVRIEHIALHSAGNQGGAQFYISCAQIKVTGGGNGNPGPLVPIPGVYTGSEPGILINIYYPIPKTYTQPGPSVWTG